MDFLIDLVVVLSTCLLMATCDEQGSHSTIQVKELEANLTSYSPAHSVQKQKRFLGKLKKKLKKFHGKWKTSKKEAKKLFKVYYECIEKKAKEMEKDEFPIQAMLALEGEKITMKCYVCYRPDQPKEDQEAQWQFLRHEDTGLVTIRDGKNHKIKKDNSLVVKDVDLHDAGQYFCLEKHDYAAVYQLDVFLKDKRKYVRLGKDDVMNATLLLPRNLWVFTMWAEWGVCNTCGREGQRKRIGQCTAKKIVASQPVEPRDYPLMALYPEGLPCHSTALPRFLRHIPAIGSRHSETLVKSCMEPCPTEPPQIMVTDETGKVIDVLEPGFYPLGAKPAIRPPVKRRVLYEPEGSHLVLNCPIDEQTELIRWMRGEREVDPSSVHRQTQGRVSVDPLNRLHMNPLLLTDTAVFNCWVKTRRVASIKVLVVEMDNQRLKMYISLVGLVITVVGSCLFFCCICCKKDGKAAR